MTKRQTEGDTRKTELLRQFGLLDSPPNEELERLAILATRLLNVPVARIFWLTERKAEPVASSTAGETNTSIPEGFLRLVLDRDAIVTTPFESSGEWAGSTDESSASASYAGVPLVREGVPVGVLGVRDRRARSYDQDDRKNLELLSHQVSALLDRHPNLSQDAQDFDRLTKNEDGSLVRNFWGLIEQAPLAFYLSDDEGQFLRVNGKACEQLEYDREDLLNRSLMDIDFSFTTKRDYRKLVDDMEPGDVREFESLHETRNRRQFPVLVKVRKTHPNSEGQLMGWVQDISEAKKRQRELHRTQDRLQTVIETAPVGIVGIDPSGRVRVWNPAAEELFGWSEEEILGEPLRIVPEDRREEHEMLKDKSVQGKSIRNLETRRLTKDGEEVDVLLSTSVVQELGGDNLVSLGYFQDISELKSTQVDLQRTLNEKANLLREVHHRVKNNLQVIQSMINLHERQFEGHREEVLDDCRDRIQTMAMIHDKLYRSEDLVDLPFVDYVEELVDNVLSLNDWSNSSTEVDVDIESDLGLPLSRAFPCGLIIHELVSNACEHGFSPGGKNRLWVEMKRKDEQVLLRVQDNGPGFPDALDPANVDSLGFEILRSLGEYELGGTLNISSQPRTTVELTFEL